MSMQRFMGAEELAHLIREQVLLAVADIGEEVVLELLPVVEGLVGAVAQLAVDTNAVHSARDHAVFADHIRDQLSAYLHEATRSEERWAYRVETGKALN